MTYLRTASEIQSAITDLASYPILWLDTETAAWWTAQPKLSLIQVLADPDDRQGDATYLLDVLDQPEVTEYFIQQIMKNPQIEKVLHNASYDLKFLGGNQAKKITCTYRLAQKLSLNQLGTPNRKLKTLAKILCQFTDVDQEQQSSDWGQRPLSPEQLLYARMDTVYVAHVHHRLLALLHPKPIQPVSPPSYQIGKSAPTPGMN